ncbi:MAG: YncE family protein [Sandaracinaceae bacterium]
MSLALMGGCNLTQTGEATPARTLNFPIALETAGVTDTGASAFLLVANSNFDLRYNTGTLMTLDLERLRTMIGDNCGETECRFADEDGSLPSELVISEVAIGSHVDGMALAPNGGSFVATGDQGTEATRVYLPVRSERSLTWLSLGLDGRLDCAQEEVDGEPIPRCGDARRGIGDDPTESERALVLNGDPISVATGRLEDIGGEPGEGNFILTALRDGRVAMFLDGAGQTPTLVHIAEGFPENLITLTMQPGEGIGWLTSSGTDAIGRVGVVLDPVRTRSFLFDAGSRRLGGVDDGEDIRDMVFHPTLPQAFVLSRRPEAVVSVDLEGRGLTANDLGLLDLWEVGQGPSRMVLTQVGGRNYVLVSCFDAQRLFVIDVDAGSLVSVVGGFSGPFEFAVDEVSEQLFLTDFSTSVIRVVDLAPLAQNQTPTVLATLGEPFSPSGL